MTSLRIVKRYALALFRGAEADGVTESVLKDLQHVKSAVESSKELKALLHSPVVRTVVKNTIFKEIFESSITKLTLDFLFFLTEKRRESELLHAIEAYEIIYYDMNGVLNVTVSSAVALAESEQKRTVEAMIKTTGKKVNANFKVDNSLIGGIKIRVGDVLYDGSVSSQLAELYSRLSGKEMPTELMAKMAS